MAPMASMRYRLVEISTSFFFKMPESLPFVFLPDARALFRILYTRYIKKKDTLWKISCQLI